MINIDDKVKIHFPMEMKPRPQQIELIQNCKNTVNNGKKYILINAPTGSGKSYFAIMFANWYRNAVNEDARIDIITNSKLLQDQYQNSFNFIKVLKGQNNYNCTRHQGFNCQEGKEMNSIQSLKKCDHCPYDIDKLTWTHSDIGITNFHLINSFMIYAPTPTLEDRNASVLICDEAHDFESVFCDFLSTKLSGKLLKKYGMDQVYIEKYEQILNNIKTVQEFMDFIQDKFIPYISVLNQKYEALLKSNENKKLYFKYYSYTSSQIEKFDNILVKYDKDPDNWSLDITYSKDKRVELIIEPIWGYDYLNEYVWKRYDHIVFMSGSILDKNMFCFINGLKPELTDYYNLESTFPIENRPLYYVKCGKMTYNTKRETFEKQVPIIKNILKKYKDKNGIIHTTNYEIADWIKNAIDDDRLIKHDPETREDIVTKFLKEGKKIRSEDEEKTNSVMISPSLMSGISLDEDLSRFQIIMKVPYPNISSNKIKSRQKADKNWYNWFTCVQIIQMAGRSVRSENDWAHTFILDSSFSDILKTTSYLPRWFTDAIILLK
jgi:Rad3-related DNA helicase